MLVGDDPSPEKKSGAFDPSFIAKAAWMLLGSA
jgi:hypothetical protein